MSKSTIIKRCVFILSIILNLVFILVWGFYKINSPTYELGILTQDINVGYFTNDSILFKIPKGITVRDVSPQGLGAIGQFENNRFEIVLTTDNADIVNYNIHKDSLPHFGNYYSIDYPTGNLRQK